MNLIDLYLCSAIAVYAAPYPGTYLDIKAATHNWLDTCTKNIEIGIAADLVDKRFEWAPPAIRSHIEGFARDRTLEGIEALCRAHHECPVTDQRRQFADEIIGKYAESWSLRHFQADWLPESVRADMQIHFTKVVSVGLNKLCDVRQDIDAKNKRIAAGLEKPTTLEVVGDFLLDQILMRVVGSYINTVIQKAGEAWHIMIDGVRVNVFTGTPEHAFII